MSGIADREQRLRHLAEASVHWIHQLEALNELTIDVLEERDVSRILHLVARRLRELIRARRVFISLPAPSGAFALPRPTARVQRTWSAIPLIPNRSSLSCSPAGGASASIHFWKIQRSIRPLPAERAA
jgi:hypothetical protein